MEKLLGEAARHDAKVVLIGDPQQLQAIEAGAAFRAIASRTGYLELTEVWRQKEDWQRDATLSFAQKRVDEGLSAYQSHGCVHEFETQAMASRALVEKWFDGSQVNPDRTQIMLSYTRKDVQELNEMARELRKGQGELIDDHAIQTERGLRQFAKGDRIYFLENERLSLNVKNGTLGTIENIEGKALTVRLDKDEREPQGRVVVVDVERYNKLEHGYAGTFHKSQGVTVDRSYILASKYMDAHATYVGMSRHRDGADLYWSREEFSHQKELSNNLSRDRSKDVTLDYAKSHGIEVSRAIVQEANKLKAPEKEIKEISVGSERRQEVNNKEQQKEHARGDEQKQQSVSRSRETLDVFKTRYEQKHPEKALQHKEIVSPSTEKEMRSIVDNYRQLQQQLERGGNDEKTRALLQKELGVCALMMSKNEQLMDYMKRYQKDIYPDVKKSAQTHELAKQKDMERSRGNELER